MFSIHEEMYHVCPFFHGCSRFVSWPRMTGEIVALEAPKNVLQSWSRSAGSGILNELVCSYPSDSGLWQQLTDTLYWLPRLVILFLDACIVSLNSIVFIIILSSLYSQAFLIDVIFNAWNLKSLDLLEIVLGFIFKFCVLNISVNHL